MAWSGELGARGEPGIHAVEDGVRGKAVVAALLDRGEQRLGVVIAVLLRVAVARAQAGLPASRLVEIARQMGERGIGGFQRAGGERRARLRKPARACQSAG